MPCVTAYRHITLTPCCPIIRTPESTKLIHQGRLIPMVGILRVTRGESVLSKCETEVIISNYKADGAVGGV